MNARTVRECYLHAGDVILHRGRPVQVRIIEHAPGAQPVVTLLTRDGRETTRPLDPDAAVTRLYANQVAA